MKAIHFGAGNIGRGFIGLLLRQSNFELSFADVSDVLIDELKRRHAYSVEIMSDVSTVIEVSGVDAFHSAKETEELFKALMEADLVTTAVGPNILPIIARTLVPVLKKRVELKITKPLNIIACENTIGGSDQIKAALWDQLTNDEQNFVSAYIGFPNSAVDRIVPNQKNDDPLWVKVEPFYEWVIDQTQIKGKLDIEGVHFVENLEAYIERKLFTVNTGHASCAYAAYQKGYQTILEAISDPEIEKQVKAVLSETGALMVKKHGFDAIEHQAYIEKTIKRFKNPAIIDEVVRVGRSPLRKLSRQDRFIRPLVECIDYHLKTDALVKAIHSVLDFDYAEDTEAVQLQAYKKELNPSDFYLKVSGLDKDSKANQLLSKS